VQRGLTKDDRNDEGLDVLCAGLVGVSRKIGDVQAQGGVVAQNSVEIFKMELVKREAKDDTSTEHHLLPRNAQARTEPVTVVGWLMTVLWLMEPPALCSVLPKTAKKTIGAIKLLKAKKYWTLV
jgi:hypothetical protein